MNVRTGTGRAQYWKWDQTHRVQFQYWAQQMTVPELAEPSAGNGMNAEPSTGNGTN